MKGLLRTIRNYFFYCGIEKEEYNAIKKDAYVSNFEVWRILHFLMFAAFAVLLIGSMLNRLLESNRMFYLFALTYSALVIVSFFILKKDSIAAQLIIYLSISLMFIFACLITQNKPEIPATTFIVFLLVAPMFMIDKPFFMAIELSAASTVFLIWMHGVKPHDIWVMDMINVVIFTLAGIFLNIIANSVRIKEFILKREISIQKDTDELTGLKNKSALTREINMALADRSSDKGIMMLLDVDKFKAINDTYGHDVGDSVIRQLGVFLGGKFVNNEVAGRFGGDEFVIFIKDISDTKTASDIAADIVKGAAENIKIPGTDHKISVSIGIAVYSGYEKNYSEIFKNADTALYRSKADPVRRYCFFE